MEGQDSVLENEGLVNEPTPETEAQSAQDVSATTEVEVKEEEKILEEESVVEASASVNEEVSDEDALDEEVETVDFSGLTKKELVEVLNKIASASEILGKIGAVREIRGAFELIHSAEREEAFHKFIEDGGEKDGFEFRNDDEAKQFFALAKSVETQIKTRHKEVEESKKQNLVKKESLLNELREIVDGEENTAGFNRVREIQNEWKDAGLVPFANVHELNNNYRALITRFYNNRAIYTDLLELDKKKNLELKVKLCEQAEELVNAESMKEAIDFLNQLHEEYKDIGPVPRDESDAVWDRFKVATQAVYDKRREKAEEFKKSLGENLKLKLELLDKVKPYVEYNSTSIKEWRTWTDQVLELQAAWKAIGPIPKNESSDFTKDFWGATKVFFANKSTFFKTLDAERELNLKKKEALCEKVEAIIEKGGDFGKNANTIKNIQGSWKEIGQAPRKQNDLIYVRFREACDRFFNQRRDAQKALDVEFVENLTKKEGICASIEKLQGAADLESFKSLVAEFEEIGFVPRDNKAAISAKFNAVCQDYLSKNDELSDQEKALVLIEAELGSLKGNPNADRILHKKKMSIRDEVRNLENEIATLDRNLEFFARSAQADAIRKDAEGKIEGHRQQISALKGQLRALNQFDN